jgi:hypothetical protein
MSKFHGENALKDKIFVDFIESQRIDMKCTSTDELESCLPLSNNHIEVMNDDDNVVVDDDDDEDKDEDGESINSITCSADQEIPRLKRKQYSFEMKSKIVTMYHTHGIEQVKKIFENINDRKLSRWKKEILEGKKPMGRPVIVDFEKEVMKEFINSGINHMDIRGKKCENRLIQECARRVSQRVVDWKEYEHIKKLQFSGRWVQGFKNRAEKREAALLSSDIDSANTTIMTTFSSLSSSDNLERKFELFPCSSSSSSDGMMK